MNNLNFNFRFATSPLASCTWIIPIILMIFCGCNSGETYYETSGAVTLDGSPVDDASVTMIPVDKSKGKHAHASTRDGGKFRMITIRKEGVLAGEYKVTVQKFDPSTGRKDAMKSLLPEGYATEDKTPLTATIPHDGELKLELKSSGE
ncbi:MAG: carboxypeptidase-like regulatory domain-containing protein [Planctomycetota bacterium]|nr:carboxypeptidase-like regulatory domain-containing protein [Planctomycetota bacterium]